MSRTSISASSCSRACSPAPTMAARRASAREPPCGDGAGRRGAHGRQVAVVEQHGFGQAGARGQHEHQPVQARQPERRVVEEAGADLDREAVEARQIGGLHVDFAVALG
jgi:hypothetical protein